MKNSMKNIPNYEKTAAHVNEAEKDHEKQYRLVYTGAPVTPDERASLPEKRPHERIIRVHPDNRTPAERGRDLLKNYGHVIED